MSEKTTLTTSPKTCEEKCLEIFQTPQLTFFPHKISSYAACLAICEKMSLVEKNMENIREKNKPLKIT